METFDRITFDPQIMGGRACIRGRRIPVSVIVGQIAHGAAITHVDQTINTAFLRGFSWCIFRSHAIPQDPS